MNDWLLHAAFAAILVASVVANGRARGVASETVGGASASVKIEPAIIRAAQSHGWTLLAKPTANEPGRTFSFDTPSCARPVLISVLSVTFDDESLIGGLGEPGDAVRYVYLDRSWSELPNRLAVFFEWKEHKALELLGLTPYVPMPYLLRLAWPRGCEIVDAIDWRVVWTRDYLMQPGPS